MDKLALAKFVANGIVGLGTGKIVTGVIANNVPVVSTIDKITVLGAGLVVGSMAKEATKAHTEAKIDEAHEQYKKLFHKK